MEEEANCNAQGCVMDSSAPAASSYRGARKRKWGKWVSEIREPGKKTRIWLGSYEEPEMAAAAYDVAASHFRGPSARLNFPEFLGALTRPASSHVEDVRFAAQQAALMFRRPLRSCRQSPREAQEGGGMVPAATVGPSSPSENQAINESPLAMWIQLAEAFMLGLDDEPIALYNNDDDDGLELRRWEEILNDPMWDF